MPVKKTELVYDVCEKITLLYFKIDKLYSDQSINKNPELATALKVSKSWAHSWNSLHTEDSNWIWKEIHYTLNKNIIYPDQFFASWQTSLVI